MIECKAAGKLYIGGEYAVVEAGNKAVLAAVDAFISVSLEEADEEGSITTYDNSPILWKRSRSRVVLDKRDNRLSYVMASIRTVENYCRENNIDLGLYHLRVESQMESKEGKKYGLGSSAAVTVATVKALASYYKIDISDLELFKLASIAQLQVNTGGSCGDIACSVYGGIVAYRSFDRDWVLEKMKEKSIRDLMDLDWPMLEIERLPYPDNFEFVVGWTKSPVSTANLVDRVKDKKSLNNLYYQKFLEDSRLVVDSMIKGFKNNDLDRIQEAIWQNRRLLVNFASELGVNIETESLRKLCNIVESFGGFGKSSGAGGGDCGIGIFKSGIDKKKLVESFNEADIDYLPLKIYEEEANEK